MGAEKMKATAMTTKWILIAVLAWMCLVLGPGKATADQGESFVEVNCDPIADTFEIRELSYSGDTRVQYKSKSEIDNDPSDSNGLYSLADLVIYENQDDPVIAKRTTLKKTCRLSIGVLRAEIEPWNYNSRALGMCGAGPPSAQVSLSRETFLLIRDVVFDPSCHSPEPAITSILVNAKSKRIIISGEYREPTLNMFEKPKTLNRIFPIPPQAVITRKEIFYTLTEVHQRIRNSFKESHDPHRAIDMLEQAGIKDILQKRPSDIEKAAYINLLNDYGFFLSESSSRYKDAIPVLQKVIALAPKRHAAYLNLGDAYRKATFGPTDPTKQEFQELAIRNYKEYARLLKEKGLESELPPRVRDALER
jgi:tetratricopeptide (TPR) repeat protein